MTKPFNIADYDPASLELFNKVTGETAPVVPWASGWPCRDGTYGVDYEPSGADSCFWEDGTPEEPGEYPNWIIRPKADLRAELEATKAELAAVREHADAMATMLEAVVYEWDGEPEDGYRYSEPVKAYRRFTEPAPEVDPLVEEEVASFARKFGMTGASSLGHMRADVFRSAIHEALRRGIELAKGGEA